LSIEISGRSNASVPAGKRIYAVGDIHGRLDLLNKIVDLIASDSEGRGEAETLVVFLGDYVDRGPNSKGVVTRLISGPWPDVTPVFLKGNHESLLLAFLDEPEAGLTWLHNGGDAALLSYGVELDLIRHASFREKAALAEACAAFRALLPDDHLQFYRSLKPCFRAGGYFFAHAGVKPGVALDLQIEADLIWIRREFLKYPGDFGAVAVHGHTPVRAPEVLHNRIGIDTLAFLTGKLTAVGLEGSRRWFLST
jgi:serine/threonine protein phosphatase 1